VLLRSIRITGNVSKKAGIRLTVMDNVPIENEGCPNQFWTTPSAFSIGPERNKPPLLGLLPI
jgi:hypothetical protein